MCIMTPCTIYEAMTEGGFDAPAPSYACERTPRWNRLYEKRDGAGDPEALSELSLIHI